MGGSAWECKIKDNRQASAQHTTALEPEHSYTSCSFSKGPPEVVVKGMVDQGKGEGPPWQAAPPARVHTPPTT